MSVISYGSNDQQIDMFFQVYDEDHNGGLSYEEIKRICKLQLHFAVQDDIIDYLADSFAKLVFELAGLSTEKLLSPLQLKRIIAQNKEKNMVEMFCASNLL